MEDSKWVLCPVCGNKTRLQLRADTELKNFPLYCPKCKQESLNKSKELTDYLKPVSSFLLKLLFGMMLIIFD